MSPIKGCMYYTDTAPSEDGNVRVYVSVIDVIKSRWVLCEVLTASGLTKYASSFPVPGDMQLIPLWEFEDNYTREGAVPISDEARDELADAWWEYRLDSAVLDPTAEKFLRWLGVDLPKG
jgi:hypothetical protein